MIYRIVFLLSLLYITACAPQVSEPILPQPEPNRTIEQPEIIDNPCITFDELDQSIRSDIEDTYVIYRDYIRSKEYDKAFSLWEKAFYAAPAANGRVRYQFDDGIFLYKNQFKTASTKEEKDKIVGAIFDLYDKRIECYPDDEYTVYGKKAFNAYYELRGYLTDTEIYDLFSKAYDGKSDDPDYFIINPFSRMIFDRSLSKEISYEEGSKYALSIIDLVNRKLNECEGKECETWEIIADYSPGILESLEGLEGFYPCDYYTEKYYADYLANSDDCDVITDTYRKMRYGKCDLNSPQMLTIKASYEKNCYVAPPSTGPLRLGLEALNDGRFKEAVSHYESYVATSSDINKKAEIQLRIAKIQYVHLKNFPQARKAALAAAQSKSNWGAPYILIGKLYASSGPLCGPGRGWDSQVVTWPAIDKFLYAKKIDSSVADEANKLITQYRKYMPSREDIFIRNINEGDSFTVPCWIQEKTRIRVAK